ncbi:MAG TPA: hypothetical protein VK149_01890 [Sideroxyarcus sp.]|nr:hypothetical protein [Sideroxyarcus sp.]
MSSPFKLHPQPARLSKQRGVVLFFSLVALLAMSLAAVALIRSVDTSTMIAGNLAFKQSATSAGDNGVEQAIGCMTGSAGCLWANNVGNYGEVLKDITNPLNNTDLANNPGFYASSTGLDLFAEATWADGNSNVYLGEDPATGNKVRYIIQRMCRSANALPANAENDIKVPPETSCLFLSAEETLDEMNIKKYQDICPTCETKGQVPVYRITAKIDGPRNTVSYVQAFVY